MATTTATDVFAPLEWDDRFVRSTPGDPDDSVRPRQVPDVAWSPVQPTPVADPRLVAWSAEVAAMLGLPADPDDGEAAQLAEVLGGNRVVAGMRPHATRYGGHQFGNWAGQLGDGRAIALGEVVTPHGHRVLQLKGAGPTPYSRRADGRAVLRSSIREFLCSEAMHHLGVPTTRALSLVTTGDTVVRDMFYDGNPEAEPGAIVCRVAPSFTRLGTFQLPAAFDEPDLLRTLVDVTLRDEFPHLGEPRSDEHRAELTVEWFREVCETTARLMVEWMRVGFVHGVMNTDNLSILGLTIDYGPYGWLEDYDRDWTPNTTDRATRRYRYGQQPAVAQWNLARFAESLLPIVGRVEPLQDGLSHYARVFDEAWWAMWSAKLGLGDEPLDDEARTFVDEVHGVLGLTETDMTLFFRHLPDCAEVGPSGSDDDLLAPLAPAFYRPDELVGDVSSGIASWVRRWTRRAGGDDLRSRMDAVNPRYVLRNYLAQEAIDAATGGDFTLVHELLDTLRRPYDDQPGRERFARRRPEWARERPGCSMLSCSS